MKTIAKAYESTKGAAKVFPPRVFITQEMEERGWTRADLARKLGMGENRLTELLTGSRTLTAETAQMLASAFGTSPDFWSNLENLYLTSHPHLSQEKYELRDGR